MQVVSNPYRNQYLGQYLTSTNSVQKARINYTYGFNGQERDDQVSGKGNSYTAEFWQYSSRLGRRWNVDPVVKPYRSPYDAFSNNPIIMIDPKGDDDYFNADGSYSHSTGKGSNIYVKSKISGTYIPLSMMNINMPSNEVAVENVVNYYAQKMGISRRVELKPNGFIYGRSSGRNPAFTMNKNVFINTSKTGLVYGGKEINSNLSDFYNLNNVLYHEKLHQGDQENGDNFDDNSFGGLYNHSSIYLRQMQHSSFENTTKLFKDHAVNSFKNYLQDALESSLDEYDEKGSEQKIYNMINQFNEGVGKQYGYKINVKKTSFKDNYSWNVSVQKYNTKTKK